MNTETSPTPIVHILKEGKSFCDMPGVPGSWPDNHLYISFQDLENASEANCPECVAARDAGPHLAERLNESNREVIPWASSRTASSPVCFCAGKLPEGVCFEETTLDAFEEKTGQSARFDPDLGRWHKLS